MGVDSIGMGSLGHGNNMGANARDVENMVMKLFFLMRLKSVGVDEAINGCKILMMEVRD